MLFRSLALVFSFWSLAGSGYQAVYYGVFCLMLGIPIYMWLKIGRNEYGETLTVPVGFTQGPTREGSVSPVQAGLPTVDATL